MMASPNVDLKMNYCRLCCREDIEPDELFYIFGDENFVKNLERYIQMQIFVEDINFSHHICIPCKDKVETMVELITGFQQNFRELQYRKRRNQSFSCPVPLGHIKDENLHLVDVDKPSNMCSSNAETTIMPEVPRQGADGGPNTSISVVANPDEWPAISTLGQHHLKQLGKKIYDKYRDDVVKTHHKTLTVSDIRNELENLEDPLQGANPTVLPNKSLNIPDSVAVLRKAMKGLGTDEDKIIQILTTCCNKQRQELAKAFETEFNRNLEADLRSELGGNFESLIVGLITPPTDYLARQLNKAMKGAGTDNNAVIEIIVTRSNDELKELVTTYEKNFNRPLAEHLCSETSGDFRKLLTLIVTGVRDFPGKPNPEKAQQLAEELFKAGEAKRGTSEEVFIRIFGHESYDQLKLMFEKYKQVSSGHTIEQALKAELSGNLLDCLLAIVECAQNPVAYFAKQLNKAMKGAGTDEQTLNRIIVSRSEIDLGNIKKEYERLYDRTLESDVKKETSGDHKKALLVLIGGP